MATSAAHDGSVAPRDRREQGGKTVPDGHLPVTERLADRTGVSIDVDAVVGRLGPPLSHEMANWFPPERVDEAVALYRSFYPADAIAPTRALPGAVDALAAVHEAGGRVVVVTAKRA